MSANELKFCLIIPCYGEHSKKLSQTLERVSLSGLKTIVVDDGSEEKFAEIIKESSESHGAILVKNSNNMGKGGAVKAGLFEAQKLGYTHAIQLDSDGQHDTQFLKKFIETSKNNPAALISGKPIFDDSIPKKRLYGRYFTHMWVWLETLSFDIKDTMCGFRSYPIEKTCSLIRRSPIGNHMDFDIEVMVKLYWSGVEVIFIPLKVLYPEEGKSYFYMFKDNYRITLMHTKLVIGMILRSPKLIGRKFTQGRWEEISEKGGVIPMKLASFLFDLFGYRFAQGICYFISLYYFLLSSNARESSRQFQKVYKNHCLRQDLKPKKFSTFGHILSFSHMVVDKFAVWKRKITPADFYAKDIDDLISLHKEGEGAVFISSHFGNIEVIRGLGKRVSKINYSSLIYTKNSKKIFQVLRSFDPEVEKNIIPVQTVGPELGFKLTKKIESGEWLFCMGDRKTAKSDKTISLNLLGRSVAIPQGPFLLAYVLDAPKVYSIHCFREKDKFRIKTKEITPQISRSRKNRTQYIQAIANAYVVDLETHIQSQPTQWFNFYKYWNEK